MRAALLYTIVLAAAVAAAPTGGASAELDPVVIKGSKFFFKTNGTQYYIKGVAYQPAQNATAANAQIFDPLADSEGCARDIALLGPAGVNAIRVYALNTSLNHDDCISQFAKAGIYIIYDLSEPQISINRDEPSWDIPIFERYKSVVDAVAKHTNTLGFFAGNEVTNNDTNTPASPYVKAAIRDTKAYLAAKNYRQIPVGYATNDDQNTRLNLRNYFNCGPANESADMYGINIYEWCGNTNFKESGYADRTKEFTDFSIPVFMSEYGCNLVQPRPFTEIKAIYGSDMIDVWSGGIAYEYFQQQNKYGLVTQLPGNKVSTLADYNNFRNQLATVSPSVINIQSYTPTASPLSCPTSGSHWAAATELPPTPDNTVCTCMIQSLGCVADPKLTAKEIADLFGVVCGLIKCNGISSNGTWPGNYGAFSICTPIDKLSWAVNEYWLSQNKADSSCNFGGKASPTSAPSLSGSCASLLKQAGSEGTGKVDSPDVLGNEGGSKKTNAANLVSPTKSSSVIVLAYAVAFFGGMGAVFV